MSLTREGPLNENNGVFQFVFTVKAENPVGRRACDPSRAAGTSTGRGISFAPFQMSGIFVLHVDIGERGADETGQAAPA